MPAPDLRLRASVKVEPVLEPPASSRASNDHDDTVNAFYCPISMVEDDDNDNIINSNNKHHYAFYKMMIIPQLTTQ